MGLSVYLHSGLYFHTKDLGYCVFLFENFLCQIYQSLQKRKKRKEKHHIACTLVRICVRVSQRRMYVFIDGAFSRKTHISHVSVGLVIDLCPRVMLCFTE